LLKKGGHFPEGGKELKNEVGEGGANNPFLTTYIAGVAGVAVPPYFSTFLLLSSGLIPFLRLMRRRG